MTTGIGTGTSTGSYFAPDRFDSAFAFTEDSGISLAEITLEKDEEVEPHSAKPTRS
jgi:hypothetical protein